MPSSVLRRRSTESAPKRHRFDARLNARQKALIQRAADLQGRTVTEFVLHSAEAAAESAIRERTMLALSARETERFVRALLSPREPGPVLRAAAGRYKKTLSR